MSYGPRQLANRPVLISLCLMSACLALAAIFAATVHASEFKMVNCAANSGAPAYTIVTNTTSPQNPAGIFTFENNCSGRGGDPPGNESFMRISEHEAGGNAGYAAYLDLNFLPPAPITFRSAGGYTRQPNAFNEGWQARFGFAYLDGSSQLQMVQGAGLQGTALGYWGTTPTFASHLWPWPYSLDFNRWTFELVCARPAGCDRANYNATDFNGIVFVLKDGQDSQVNFTNPGSDLLQGRWVKGSQDATWQSSDNGSGLRLERLRVGDEPRYVLDYQAIGACDTSYTTTNQEFARKFQPCPTGGPYGRSHSLNTTTLGDGAHYLSICTKDYGQFQGLNGTGSETCDARTIRTDNTAPGAPSGLFVTTTNPSRYLDRFGAQFSLPPNQGSPITKVHYNVVTADGTVVMPEKVVSGANPTSLAGIEGPAKAGAYRLQVWLEDEVGLVGPATTASVPRDTTPPAAPQGLAVTVPTTSRATDGFDLRWYNLTDAGAPINGVHYQVLNGAGTVVVPTKTVNGDNVQAIENLETPNERGNFTLRLWLSDAEGNVGAAASVPLAYDCVRSDVSGGTGLSAGFAGAPSTVVKEGAGATLAGELHGAGANIAAAPLCVYAQVVTDAGREFLGLAVTDRAGGYSFPVAPGPSRNLSVIYRPGQRRLSAQATLQTRVRPSFKVRRRVVYNKHVAHFFGAIPGPHNDRVVIVLQAKVGKGWLTFRRYRTRDDGKFVADYRFNRTFAPTNYVMRAQVRSTVGYPYLQGNSRQLVLRALPAKRR